MPDAPVFSIIGHGTPQYLEAVRLRDEILRNPEGRVTTPEDMVAERACTHVVGTIGGEVVATCLLVEELAKVRMKRVAVAVGSQGQGIGSTMLEFCERHGRSLGAIELYAHARETAVGFYVRAGYVTKGAYFSEVGIPHLLVRKPL
ncbi:MAG: GNAT family N-acetyltransferase [Polyangiales bacterium]